MRRAFLFLIACVVGFAASAQDYRFQVPDAQVTVIIEPEGSVVIHYKLTFVCMQGAHPIDVVDIGMPNMARHTPGDAEVDGKPLPRSAVRISEFLKPRGSGYEIQLGSKTVYPGKTGVFEFTARENKMVWEDTTNSELASFRFTPTWFGSQYLVGPTKLTLRYVLPIPAEDYPAVKDQILWQRKGEDFSVKGVLEGEDWASVAWVRQVQLTHANEFGISFPRRYVSSIRHDTIWALFVRWFEGNPDVQLGSGIFLVVVFAAAFFFLTRGTGFVIFLVGAGAMAFGMVRSVYIHFALYPAVLLFACLVYLLRSRRKKHYFPAVLCREGGGLKRGLTAVEAAVLLEVPLNKVLTMIIFGLVRKGILTVVEQEPLRVGVAGKVRTTGTWARPDGTTVRLWSYEPDFLEVFQARQTKAVEDMDLEKPFDALIDRVSKELKGFDLDASRAYYRQIVTRAWDMVKAEAGYEARYEAVDKHLGWLMLDGDWDRRLRESDLGTTYYPHWWHGRSYTPPSFPSGGGMPAPPRSVPSASFGDVANAITGRFENVSTKLAGSLDAFKAAPTLGLDLSSVDHYTGEFLKALASGSGGGRGGGGGGGCACAGCACACACAGGGR